MEIYFFVLIFYKKKNTTKHILAKGLFLAKNAFFKKLEVNFAKFKGENGNPYVGPWLCSPVIDINKPPKKRPFLKEALF